MDTLERIMILESINKHRHSVGANAEESDHKSSSTLHDAHAGSEWHRNLAYAPDFRCMLAELFHEPPQASQDFVLYSSFPESVSQRLDLGRCQSFADAANSILLRYYSKCPPTVHKPAIFFHSASTAIPGDNESGMRILVVLRDQWETMRNATCLTSPEHTHPQAQGGCKLDPATEVHPPWDIVVAVLEFGRNEAPAPDTPPPSLPQEACDDRGRKRPRATSEDLSLSRPPKIRRVGSPSPSPQMQEAYDTPVEECLTHSSPRTSIDGYHPHSFIQPDPEAGLLDCFHQLLTGATYRSWALGAIIEAHQISLVSCDRGGLVQSSPVDMRSPEGFQLLCDWILTLGSSSIDQWGFTNLFGNIGNPVQATEFDVPLTTLHLSFGLLRYRQRGTFGRCTNVFDVTIRTGDTNIDGVCKIAWPILSGQNEHDLIKKAHAMDPIHTPKVHCAWDVLTELPSKKLRPHCTDTRHIEERTMRVTVMTKYQPIDNLEGEEFLEAFTQIMKCNVALYEAGSVHHRDLSPGNMMYHRDMAGQIIGVLTDFDLAVSLEETTQDTGRRSRHGTAPFMPQALLSGRESEHTLQHDFESAFYILVWVGMGYKGGKPPLDTGDPLRFWREGRWEEIAMAKCMFMRQLRDLSAVMELIRPEYKSLVQPIEKLIAALNVQAIPGWLVKEIAPDLAPFVFTSQLFFEYLAAK